MAPMRTLLTSQSGPPPYFFGGGRAQLSAISSNWNGGSVQLQWQGPDQSTMLPIAGATLTANGVVGGLDLPPGMYSLAVTGGPPAGLVAALDRVPD